MMELARDADPLGYNILAIFDTECHQVQLLEVIGHGI